MIDFLTYGQVKNSSVARISGACPGSAQFLEFVNEAVERLMTRGDWAQTLVPIHMCIKSGCVTWPRFVGSIRKLRFCGTVVPITNLYSSYLERGAWPNWYDFPNMGSWGNVGSGGWGTLGKFYNLQAIIDGANKVGYYSTYNDPPTGATRYIRAYPQFPEDVGKTVTIYGKDENGQPLVTKTTDSSGVVTYPLGAKITIASPYGSTAVPVQGPIDRVLIQDGTVGRIYLYAYDATEDLLTDLAVYQAGETNPTYERMRIPGVQTASNGTCSRSVMGLVKLKFIPVVNDEDLILIPNMGAIKTMYQALIFEDSNDDDRAARYEARAIRELNLQLRDQYPEDETSITVEAFNSTGVGRQSMF